MRAVLKVTFHLFVVSRLVTLTMKNLACLFTNLIAVSDKNFVVISVMEREVQMFYYGVGYLGRVRLFSKLQQL